MLLISIPQMIRNGDSMADDELNAWRVLCGWAVVEGYLPLGEDSE